MSKKMHAIAMLALLFLWMPCAAQIGSGANLGSGARAMALAGNHTAAAKDLSAVYWNPAALAFMPIRELHASFDGMRLYGMSEFDAGGPPVPPGARMGDHRDRLRMSSLGIVSAMPTVQGGLTLAASFDRPYVFDDFTVYTYEWGEATVKNDGRSYGDLNRWNGAFGIQVAPKVAAGLTIAVITGSEKAPIRQEKTASQYDSIYDVYSQYRYLGYAVDIGALYELSDILKLGVKFNAVSNVGFNETRTQLNSDNSKTTYHDIKGRAYTAPCGALGAALTLPWITAAADLRVTMPYTFILPSEDTEGMPDDVQARYFKFGAGLGLEAPLAKSPVVLRAGYSFDEYNIHNMIRKEDGDRIDWNDDYNAMGRGFWPSQNRHTIAVGAGVFTSGIGLELSYAYQTWGLADFWSVLAFRQDYSSHRVMAAVSYRY